MNHYLHNLNPYAFQFPEFVQRAIESVFGPASEPLGVRWYGMAYLVGFVAGYWVVTRLVRRGGLLATNEELLDFTTYAAFGTLIGGRVGYAIFYSPELLVEWGGGFPFWGVLKVHQGGMASHGGILGIMVATAIFCWRRKKPFLHLLDLTTFGGTLGIFFGRLANFVNGELFGRPVESSVRWAVQFPQEMYLWMSTAVAKLLPLSNAVVALGPVAPSPNGVAAVITEETWRNWVMSYNTDSASRRAVEYCVESLVNAVQHGNLVVSEALALVLTPRHPSQIYQAFLEGLFVFFVLVAVWRKPQKPGVISAVFGLSYAIARIIGEQYRLPDAHIGFQALGLTRGQWLSIGFVFVALLVLYFARRAATQPLGGWGARSPAVAAKPNNIKS